MRWWKSIISLRILQQKVAFNVFNFLSTKPLLHFDAKISRKRNISQSSRVYQDNRHNWPSFLPSTIRNVHFLSSLRRLLGIASLACFWDSFCEGFCSIFLCGQSRSEQEEKGRSSARRMVFWIYVATWFLLQTKKCLQKGRSSGLLKIKF